TRPQARTPPTLRSVVANTSVSASGERGQASIDRLLAAGPPAAKALLDHFSHSKNKRTRALLSPKARAALEWLQIERAPLPPKLHNALTHLLVSMAKSEQDPVEIISPVQPASDVTPVELADLPPLPANARQRMELLSQNVEAMEAFARERYDFSKERVLSTALIKLKDRNLNLRPIEIGPLQ